MKRYNQGIWEVPAWVRGLREKILSIEQIGLEGSSGSGLGSGNRPCKADSPRPQLECDLNSPAHSPSAPGPGAEHPSLQELAGMCDCWRQLCAGWGPRCSLADRVPLSVMSGPRILCGAHREGKQSGRAVGVTEQV